MSKSVIHCDWNSSPFCIFTGDDVIIKEEITEIKAEIPKGRA
jgi:hypothetical protein